MIRALVFDFDGLILETESPVMESWRRVYEDMGVELPLDTWLDTIGTADHEFDPFTHLEGLLGRKLAAEPLQTRRKHYRDAILHAQEILPGVREWIAEARQLGMRLAIASSSEREWVVGHLARLGADTHWDAIRTRGDVQRSKPDPELYLAAAAALGVAPGEALAIEDSANGLTAARAAGMKCVVCPGPLTRHMDFSKADLVVTSLADMPLSQALRKLSAD